MERTVSYVPVIGYLSETLRESEFMLVDIGCSSESTASGEGLGLGYEPWRSTQILRDRAAEER